jgi:hypothetical protein
LHDDDSDFEVSFASSLHLDNNLFHLQQTCTSANMNHHSGATILGTSAPKTASTAHEARDGSQPPPPAQYHSTPKPPERDSDESAGVRHEVNPLSREAAPSRKTESLTVPPAGSPHSSYAPSNGSGTLSVRDGLLSAQCTPSSCASVASMASGILHLHRSCSSRSGCPLPPPAVKARSNQSDKHFPLFDHESSGGSSVSSASRVPCARSGVSTMTAGGSDLTSLRGQNGTRFSGNSSGPNGNELWTPPLMDDALAVEMQNRQELPHVSGCSSSRHTQRRQRHRTLGATHATHVHRAAAVPVSFATITDLRRTASTVSAVVRCNSSNLSHLNVQAQVCDDSQWCRNASIQMLSKFDDEQPTTLTAEEVSRGVDGDEGPQSFGPPIRGPCAPICLTLATFTPRE